jgi:hypothetical protein
MEMKVWDCSFSREDVEVSISRALTDGEWNIVVDELIHTLNKCSAQVEMHDVINMTSY